MPMIDLCIPEGALEAKAENRLLEELTDILIRHEGLDPGDQRIRGVTWIFVHHPKIYRAGAATRQPVYRITPSVPEGQYTDEARASLVKEVTEAVARAEGRDVKDVSGRVWIFPTEIPDGGWGSRGAIQRLPDIMAYFGGEPMRERGIQRLEAKRRRNVIPVLEAIVETIRRADGATAESSRGTSGSCQGRGESTSLRQKQHCLSHTQHICEPTKSEGDQNEILHRHS